MKPDSASPNQPQVEALKKELEGLQQEALRRDEEARRIERESKENRERLSEEQQSAARELIARWIMRERFGLVVMGIGLAFAALLVVLPPVQGKAWLYGCALCCVTIGAWQKDRANRKIANLLPTLDDTELLSVRKKW